MKRVLALLACAVALATASAAFAQDAQDAPVSPKLAFVDPTIASKPFKPGRNPIYRQLKQVEDQYAGTWGALPFVPVPAGAELKPGAAGPRLVALRKRLGLDPEGTYDDAVVDLISKFQAAHGLPPTGIADPLTIRALNAGPEPYERAIAGSLERAFLLPPNMGRRYILVDAAAGELTYFVDGEPMLAMKVVTGRPNAPTPLMIGMVKTLVFNPYWNVPEDLLRTSIAPKVLAGGQKYVKDFGIQVLSNYTDQAEELDPAKVNWKAVKTGALDIRVRQRPGPKNMMGQVKLMLPNPLGIYLHDTPFKTDFTKDARLQSSGCIRLEDAMALVRLIVGDDVVAANADGSGEEHIVTLDNPIPVYVTYFTAMPTVDGMVFRKDAYGLDAKVEVANHPVDEGLVQKTSTR